MRRHALHALWVLGTLALGCRGANGPAPSAPPRRADQLTARDPDTLGRPPSGRTELGSLTPVATDRRERAAPAPAIAIDETAAVRLRIDVADDAATAPYPLRDGALVLPGGLTIHRVPRGLTVRALRERGTGDDVWEVVDARGRRQALIKARSWSRAVAAEDALAESAPVRAARLRATWRGVPVDVRVDRFQQASRIYTIERRAAGTEWLWRGLSLSE